MRKLIDLTGKTFGNLIVLEHSHATNLKEHYWTCKCQCGAIYNVLGSNLRYGKVKSCKECSHKFDPLPKGQAAMNAVVHNIKSSADKRMLEMLLTYDQIKELIAQPCYYCGNIASNYMIHKSTCKGKTYKSNGGLAYNGLDRVDNTKGYIIGNVVPCCKHCNSAKGKLTIEEFRLWVERISNHLNNKGWGSLEDSKLS